MITNNVYYIAPGQNCLPSRMEPYRPFRDDEALCFVAVLHHHGYEACLEGQTCAIHGEKYVEIYTLWEKTREKT